MSKLATLAHSSFFKGVTLVFLLLLLCIPLWQIESLITERIGSDHMANSELASTYVGRQTLVGPVMLVPYTERWQTTEAGEKDKPPRLVEHRVDRLAARYPDQWSLDGDLAPEERYRGLFTVLFYRLTGRVQGGFGPFDPATLPRSVPNATIEVGTPVVTLRVSDLRGLQGAPQLTAAGTALAFERRAAGAADAHPLAAGVHAPLTGAALAAFRAGRPLPFSLALTLLGHQSFSVVPLGAETEAHLRSNWPHPSFGGRFLAAERSVTAQGFDARWRVSSLTTTAREQLDQLMSAKPAENPRGSDAMDRLDDFSVNFVQPVNVYTMTDRAVRYGFLFIALTLMAVFMVELFARLRLHPVQYALVGLSIAVFFLLLLALSEKIGFGRSYLGASGASVALLATYFSAMLRSARRGLLLAGFVAVLYGALYGLLASESHALMLGSLLVFGMLATLMLATRHVDWWSLGNPSR